MILAVDIGNIRTLIALFDSDGSCRFRSELGTDRRLKEDQQAIALLDIFRLHNTDIGCVTGAILSSVVPSMTSIYVSAINRLTGKTALVVGPGIKTGLNIRADIHNQLGSDIVASAVSAISNYPSPVIVINSQTAVSFSYMSGNTFEGCSIMPGMGIALEALSSTGAQLPHISMGDVGSPLGRNTVDSMRAGIIYGYAGAFDRLIDELEQAAGQKAAAIVVTGENFPTLFGLSKHELIYDHDLLVKGLYQIYIKNTEKTRR